MVLLMSVPIHWLSLVTHIRSYLTEQRLCFVDVDPVGCLELDHLAGYPDLSGEIQSVHVVDPEKGERSIRVFFLEKFRMVRMQRAFFLPFYQFWRAVLKLKKPPGKPSWLSVFVIWAL